MKVVPVLRKHCSLITRLTVRSVTRLANACCRTITLSTDRANGGLTFMPLVAAVEMLGQPLLFLSIAASCAHDAFGSHERSPVQQNSWSLPVVRKKKLIRSLDFRLIKRVTV